MESVLKQGKNGYPVSDGGDSSKMEVDIEERPVPKPPPFPYQLPRSLPPLPPAQPLATSSTKILADSITSKLKILQEDVTNEARIERQVLIYVAYSVDHVEFVDKTFSRLLFMLLKGVLVVDERGTGTTCPSLATGAKVSVVEVKVQQLEASLWVGRSSSSVREWFQSMRDLAPVIIFVEGFDLIAGVRGKFIHTKKHDHEAFTSQFLVELKGFEKQDGVVLMATSQNLNQIDEALLCPGRLDRIFHHERPTQKERERFLHTSTRETMDDDLIDLVNWRKIAEKTVFLHFIELKFISLSLEGSTLRRKSVNTAEILSFGWFATTSQLVHSLVRKSKNLKRVSKVLMDHLGFILTKEDLQDGRQINNGIKLLTPPPYWDKDTKYPHVVWVANHGLMALLLPDFDVVDNLWLEPSSSWYKTFMQLKVQNLQFNLVGEYCQMEIVKLSASLCCIGVGTDFLNILSALKITLEDTQFGYYINKHFWQSHSFIGMGALVNPFEWEIYFLLPCEYCCFLFVGVKLEVMMRELRQLLIAFFGIIAFHRVDKLFRLIKGFDCSFQKLDCNDKNLYHQGVKSLAREYITSILIKLINSFTEVVLILYIGGDTFSVLNFEVGGYSHGSELEGEKVGFLLLILEMILLETTNIKKFCCFMMVKVAYLNGLSVGYMRVLIEIFWETTGSNLVSLEGKKLVQDKFITFGPWGQGPQIGRSNVVYTQTMCTGNEAKVFVGVSLELFAGGSRDLVIKSG